MISNSITLPLIPVIVTFSSAFICAYRKPEHKDPNFSLWNPQKFFIFVFIFILITMLLVNGFDITPHAHTVQIHYDSYLVSYHEHSYWFDYLTNNALFVELLTGLFVLCEERLQNGNFVLDADVNVFVTLLLLQCSMLSTFVVTTLSQFTFTPIVSSLVQVPLCVHQQFFTLICNAIVHTMPFVIFNCVMYIRVWQRNNNADLPGRRIDFTDVIVSSLSFLWIILMYYYEDLWQCAYNLLHTQYASTLFYNNEVFFTGFVIAFAWPLFLYAVH